MANSKKNSGIDGTRLILLILALFTWFIGALLYLFMVKPKGMELVVCVLAVFIPIIPAVLLWLNAFGIINLK
ncbi:MAG: hypothetical protein ACRCXE_02185 [Metamycoplasmataceae bacterium]